MGSTWNFSSWHCLVNFCFTCAFADSPKGAENAAGDLLMWLSYNWANWASRTASGCTALCWCLLFQTMGWASSTGGRKQLIWKSFFFLFSALVECARYCTCFCVPVEGCVGLLTHHTGACFHIHTHLHINLCICVPPANVYLLCVYVYIYTCI